MKASVEGGGTITQKFGPAASGVQSFEPAMYATGTDKAYWVQYAGGLYYQHYHPGIDRAAPSGAPVLAMEQGKVVQAGWYGSIDGNRVAVEINPRCTYYVNHLSRVDVKAGEQVAEGRRLGLVGMTGSATGPHVHEGLSIKETDKYGTTRTFLWNAALFLPGGRLYGDERVRPLKQSDKFFVDGGGINIFFAPPDQPLRVFATSRVKGQNGWIRDTGIYRRSDHQKIAGIGYGFKFLNYRHTAEGTFCIGLYRERKIAVYSRDCHF